MARLLIVALLALGGIAAADPGTRRAVVDMPLEKYVRTSPGASISPFLYLNRCRGGCTIKGGMNDARMNASAIPPPGTYTVGEFANAYAQIGTTGTCLGD